MSHKVIFQLLDVECVHTQKEMGKIPFKTFSILGLKKKKKKMGQQCILMKGPVHAGTEPVMESAK